MIRKITYYTSIGQHQRNSTYCFFVSGLWSRGFNKFYQITITQEKGQYDAMPIKTGIRNNSYTTVQSNQTATFLLISGCYLYTNVPEQRN